MNALGRPLLIVTDDTTDDEIRESIRLLNVDAMRMPRHFVERKAELHRKIDALLDELDERR